MVRMACLRGSDAICEIGGMRERERKKERKNEYLNRKWWKKRWFCGMCKQNNHFEDQQNNFHCWKEHLETEEIENANVLCKEMEVVQANEWRPREIWFNLGRFEISNNQIW